MIRDKRQGELELSLRSYSNLTYAYWVLGPRNSPESFLKVPKGKILIIVIVSKTDLIPLDNN